MFGMGAIVRPQIQSAGGRGSARLMRTKVAASSASHKWPIQHGQMCGWCSVASRVRFRHAPALAHDPMTVIEYDSTRTALYHPEQRDTVFAPGVACSAVQLAVETARLAYVRTEESAEQRDRLATALSCCGFDAPESFGHALTGSHAFGCIRPADGAAILAFRGTQPDDLADLAIDLDAVAGPWQEAAGSVHSGFARAARSLMPEIADWMARVSVQPAHLTLTGHSLGAAIATLAATVWKPSRLVTLGSPRVGNSDFTATLAGIDCTRIVDCCDAITDLPPALGHYVHAGPATYINRLGEVLAGPADEFVAADRTKARSEYVARYAWRIGSVLVRDLADHAPINYARAFFR
ncbi:MAG: lipase family protein [Caldimonas sp.]